MPKPNPETARKLLRFIEAWRSGASMETAAKRAGIDAKTARGFIDGVKQSLEDSSGEASLPAKPARPKMKKRSRSGLLRLSAVSDGASRGNPGKAACAVIVYDEDGDELLRDSRSLGVATNNVAEYHGVLLALELADQLGAAEVDLRLDSELVVKQLNGQYKVKHEAMKPLYKQVRIAMTKFARVAVRHVPRTETKEADALANAELDGKAGD